MAIKPVVLIIRDGWGVCPPSEYNAVSHACTDNVGKYLAEYPSCLLDASGESVGLPAGFQGSSEVGHLNMGAGRIVVQELKRLQELIASDTLFSAPAFKNAIDNCVAKKSALHLMGLVQDEGVHAHQDHLFAIMRHAREKGVATVYIHFFADGRDTPPRSALGFIKTLENKIKETGIGQIGTVIGRYYAMDRSENWKLNDMAYNAICFAEGVKAPSAEAAVTRAYGEDKNPDGTDLTDEYVPPSIIGSYSGVKDGDSVIHFNFRQDRAIQLTKAFVEDAYPGSRRRKFDVAYCGLTRYYDTFRFNALSPMDEDSGMTNLLGEVIGAKGLKQLRIAETQKFKHVTSFFNGKLLKPYAGEDRIEIKGTIDPSAFGDHPEMNAKEVTDETVRQIKSGKYDFILVNFANCDMVGHTGNFKSVVKAVEIVDQSVGRVVSAALEMGGAALVTADHGNAEEMWNYEINMPKTSHTTNLVEFIVISKEGKNIRLREKGILSDIAPTVLHLMDIRPPAEMTSKDLIVS